MQERHLDELSGFYNEDIFNPEKMKAKHFDPKELAERIERQTTNLPPETRTPTAYEVDQMNKFRAEYQKKNPKATNRQVRRAIQKKFSITVLPNTPLESLKPIFSQEFLKDRSFLFSQLELLDLSNATMDLYDSGMPLSFKVDASLNANVITALVIDVDKYILYSIDTLTVKPVFSGMLDLAAVFHAYQLSFKGEVYFDKEKTLFQNKPLSE